MTDEILLDELLGQLESFRNMHKLHSTYICNQCAFENTVALDD